MQHELREKCFRSNNSQVKIKLVVKLQANTRNFNLETEWKIKNTAENNLVAIFRC